MNRHYVNNRQYNKIKAQYSLTEEELSIENSTDVEPTPVYAIHRQFAENFWKAIKKKALSPLDDIYVDYDFFRTKILCITIDEGKKDMQLVAEV